MTGTVTKSTGKWCWIRTSDDQTYKCRISGKLRLQEIESTNPVAVGDEVDFKLEPKRNTGILLDIHERKNYIVRRSVNLSKRTHILASNIDLAFMLVTVDYPPTFPSFIDRFLATAEAYEIDAVLLFNKMDLYNEEQLAQVRALSSVYTAAGYDCLHISAKEGTNLHLLKELMAGQISLFAGNSGVGKTTLLNALQPGLDLRTDIISARYNQGQHTTTFAEMFHLSFGGFIIDTPGIKGFGTVDLEPNSLSDYFPEFFRLQINCKFHNCLHVNEPDCAVKKALDEGTIASSRYRSYTQILEGDDDTYRIDVCSKSSRLL